MKTNFVAGWGGGGGKENVSLAFLAKSESIYAEGTEHRPPVLSWWNIWNNRCHPKFLRAEESEEGPIKMKGGKT